MGQRIAVGVEPGRFLPDNDAQRHHVPELLHVFVRRPEGQRFDRDEVVGRQRRLHLCAHVGVRHPETGRELSDYRLLVGDQVRHDADDRQVRIDGQGRAQPVVDRATAGHLCEEVDQVGPVDPLEVERRRPIDLPGCGNRTTGGAASRRSRAVLDQRDRVRLRPVIKERRMERHLELDRCGLLAAGPDLVVDAGDLSFIRDRGVAVDEVLLADRRRRSCRNERVHLFVLAVLPEFQPAFGRLVRRLRGLGDGRVAVAAAATGNEQQGERSEQQQGRAGHRRRPPCGFYQGRARQTLHLLYG